MNIHFYEGTYIKFDIESAKSRIGDTQYIKSKSTFLLVWQPFFSLRKLPFSNAIEQVIKQLSSHQMHYFYKA